MQPNKIAVVVNPASANGKTGKKWPEVENAFKNAGVSIDVTFTGAPHHATEITRNYLYDGYNLIISVGGDGTANEVVNGFFEDGKPINELAAAGFMSTGTGRDLGRTIGTPEGINEAVLHILNSPVRSVDLGRVNYISNEGKQEKRSFINIAGIGLDGETVARVNRTSKALGGFISFLWGTLVSLLLYKNKAMTISIDGKEVFKEKVAVIVVGNGRYFGGGMCIAPGADISDGEFDIVVIKGMTKASLIVNLPKVYAGKHLFHPNITTMKGKNVVVYSSESALLDLDGEQPGKAPVEIELLPGAMQLKG